MSLIKTEDYHQIHLGAKRDRRRLRIHNSYSCRHFFHRHTPLWNMVI